MKREIKFRVWDKVDYMSSPFTLMDLQEGKIQFTKDCVVMQYTGIKDKHGVEIYEGDFLKLTCIRGNETYSFIREIGFVEHSARFHAMKTLCDNLREYIEDLSGKNISEVIGNKYQNPELLEQCKY